jgi:hypothetical protein
MGDDVVELAERLIQLTDIARSLVNIAKAHLLYHFAAAAYLSLRQINTHELRTGQRSAHRHKIKASATT